MTAVTLGKVYPERAARTTPRWVAIFKGPVSYWHITLPLRTTEVDQAGALAYAAEHAIPDGCALTA